VDSFRQNQLKVILEAILKINLQCGSKRMRLLYILMRSLSMSNEVAKELIKLKALEEIVG